jgi:3-hydroxybutyryl-CoA dehydrogenase
VETIAVIGAGTMGSGIAQLAALQGCTVHLVDVSQEVLESSLAEIRGRFDHSVEKGKLKSAQRDAALARLRPADTITGLEEIELAIEAVVEDLPTKQAVFRSLDRSVPADIILATNTSSLSVTRIAEAVGDPSRVVGMHFFCPAPVMPLVEVIAGKDSAKRCVDQAIDIVVSWGKIPVRVKDTPGFIVNRVARGFYLEAIRLLGEGVAGVDEIDAILRTHGGFKMGPFELMDLIGLDVNLAASESVYERLGKKPRLAPHEIQRDLVAQGKLGRKTGEGFYSYRHAHPLPAFIVERKSFQLNPLLCDVLLAFSARAGAPQTTSTEQYVLARILAAVINEAGFAFAEEVASAGDIDVALEVGMNYPRGPLAWADEIGHNTTAGMLKALNNALPGDRYAPAPLFARAKA